PFRAGFCWIVRLRSGIVGVFPLQISYHRTAVGCVPSSFVRNAAVSALNWLKTLAASFLPCRPVRRRPATRSQRPRLAAPELRTLPSVSLISQFNGLQISYTQGYVPPDTCGAAGPSKYVETVNQTLRLSNKTTGAALATANFDTFLYTTGGLTKTDGGSFLS